MSRASDRANVATTSRWQEIREKLEKAVISGNIAVDGRLPSENALAASFGVHRHTVRRALAELAAVGLVRIKKGGGTFIEEEMLEYRIGRRTRFSENAKRCGMEQHAQLLDSEEKRASADVADALGLRRGQHVIVLTTLRHVNGRPLSLSSHHFARDRFRGIRDAFLTTGSISLALNELGVSDYFRRSSLVTARLPSEEEAKCLSQPRSLPILVIDSVNVAPDRSPVLFTIARMSAPRAQLMFEISEP